MDEEQSGRLTVLMAEYQAGSIEAFDALYRLLAPALLAYLTSLARDRVRAEDLVQDTFLQFHRSRRAYRPELPVRPWAFAIARHVWLMDCRRRRRRPIAERDLPELPVPAEVENLGARDELSRALEGVLPDRREPLLLHHVWGFTFAEIGQMLGVRADAAKLRSSRGMADLRRRLGGERRG